MEQGTNEKIRFQADDNFDTYEDFEEYFIHCINTCGHAKKEIGHQLGYKQTAFSLRLNLIDTGNFPRFNIKDLVLYMVSYRDFRPVRYLEFIEQRSMDKEDKSLAQRVAKVGKELDEIYGLLRMSRK